MFLLLTLYSILNTVINVLIYFKSNRFKIKYMIWNNLILMVYIFYCIFVILSNFYPSYLFNDVVTIHALHLLSFGLGIFFISNILYLSDLLLIFYLKKENNSGFGFIFKKNRIVF